MFFGGAALIVYSVNLKNKSVIYEYDRNCSGVAFYIPRLALEFDYMYQDHNGMFYKSKWLPSEPFINTSLLVNYASNKPECSFIENVPGTATVADAISCINVGMVNWLSPLVLTIGVLTMTIGATIGARIVQIFLARPT